MMDAMKSNLSMGGRAPHYSLNTPWLRTANRISRMVWRLMRRLLVTLCKHWKAVVVIGSLAIPIWLFLWVFISFDLLRDSRSIGLHLSWNTPQQSFSRLAQLVNLPVDSKGSKAYLRTLADAAAQKHGIDPGLFRALITQESAWNPSAVSARGAAGLTQLMPATALDACGLQPAERFDPTKNLDCGAQYFSKQLRRFKSVDLALAAYNAGPTRVAKLGRIPRITETQNYVARILEHWQGAG